jgi:hypothetical protein
MRERIEMSDQGSLPALSETHTGKGFTVNLAGVPIPLRRSFAALDRLIALPLEALGDRMEGKFKNNLNSHVEAVQTKRSVKGKKAQLDDPSVKTTRAITEWAAQAGGVEPEDKELSALWRTILDKIMENEDEGEDLLRIVQSLSNADVRYFLNRFAKKRTLVGYFTLVTPEGAADRLHSAGLILRPVNVPFLFGSAILLLVVFSFLRSLMPINISLAFISLGPKTNSVINALFVMVAAAGLIFFLKYSPTTIGARLCELYREYHDQY